VRSVERAACLQPTALRTDSWRLNQHSTSYARRAAGVPPAALLLSVKEKAALPVSGARPSAHATASNAVIQRREPDAFVAGILRLPLSHARLREAHGCALVTAAVGQTEKAIRELGRMAFRMNCRCSHGSVHPLAIGNLTKEAALGFRKEIHPRVSAGPSSRTMVLESIEKSGEAGRHELLNRVLCLEPTTNSVTGMAWHRSGRRMNFVSRGRRCALFERNRDQPSPYSTVYFIGEME
jgi:hypothetical protein